jgi:Bacterial TniB protein
MGRSRTCCGLSENKQSWGMTHASRGLLRERWIDYPRAMQALQQLERLYEVPHRDRMPFLLLHGDSNIGKMKITAKFRRAHPNAFDNRSGVERCSVVAMQMPPSPDQHRFY